MRGNSSGDDSSSFFRGTTAGWPCSSDLVGRHFRCWWNRRKEKRIGVSSIGRAEQGVYGPGIHVSHSGIGNARGWSDEGLKKVCANVVLSVNSFSYNLT